MTALETLTKRSTEDNTQYHIIIPKDVSCSQMSERITEDIVRDILKKNRKKYPKITIEEQQSQNPRIKKLLKHASKSGLGGGGES